MPPLRGRAAEGLGLEQVFSISTHPLQDVHATRPGGHECGGQVKANGPLHGVEPLQDREGVPGTLDSRQGCCWHGKEHVMLAAEMQGHQLQLLQGPMCAEGL